MVDIYYDKIYGTYIFNTVGGISKCIHEPGTAPAEDPRISIFNAASAFIFPDDYMVFEVEMSNIGHASDSFFYIAQEAGSRNLPVTIDTSLDIDENGLVIQLYKDTPVIKQIAIARGFLKYEFGPVHLTLKSMCEADMNVDSGKYKTVPLSNTVDIDGNEILKWIEPCPEVHWAGELKRDKKFIINTESDPVERYLVTVFNPLATKGKSFNSQGLNSNGRLKNVFFKYRQQGTTVWKNGLTQSILGSTVSMDYLHDFVEEDSYGFAALDWFVEGKVAEGTYEVMVETICTNVGGPPEIGGYREDIITGVIDLTRPEQYGQSLPLRNDVIVGEEIAVIFTEEIYCKIPHTFDIEVTISNTPYFFDRDQLLVICEGRKIGFQLDLSIGVEVSKIVGKEFEVEIGRIGGASLSVVMDANLNPMDPLMGNIRFKKRFGDLDLSTASTSFTFTMRDVECDDKTVKKQAD